MATFPFLRILDGTTFNMGQLVCGYTNGDDHRGRPKYEGTLLDIACGGSLTQRLADPGRERRGSACINITRAEAGAPYRPGMMVHVWFDTMVPVKPFDPTQPTRTRSGQTVIVERTGDPARPYRATMEVGGVPLTLTYDQYGVFMPGFDQPVDLIQENA